MAVLSVILTPAPVSVRTLVAVAVIAWVIRRHQCSPTCRVLQHHEADDRWWVFSQQRAQCIPFLNPHAATVTGRLDGRLVKLGYRSPLIVVLAIQSDDTRIHRVAVWQDQISGVDFSYLHQRMAFAARPPVARTLGVWLTGLLT
jgi:hypothetical protein